MELEQSGKKETYPLHEETNDTLVIQCSDPRFQEAFRTFIQEEFGIKTYSSIVIPGASQVLTFSDFLPNLAVSLSRQLKFLVKEQGLKRLIIITHDECLWYKDFVPTYINVKGNIKGQQIKDILESR